MPKGQMSFQSVVQQSTGLMGRPTRPRGRKMPFFRAPLEKEIRDGLLTGLSMGAGANQRSSPSAWKRGNRDPVYVTRAAARLPCRPAGNQRGLSKHNCRGLCRRSMGTKRSQRATSTPCINGHSSQTPLTERRVGAMRSVGGREVARKQPIGWGRFAKGKSRGIHFQVCGC